MSFRFSQASLFAGVGALLVVVALVIGAFALGMLPLSGNAAVGSNQIAFVSYRDGDAEIYVMNADGSGIKQLTENDSRDGFPSWSPDGRIVFVSDRDNDEEIEDIYVMNADGSGVEQLTDDCSNVTPVWSPDGDRIAFHSRGDIYVMNADGSGIEQLTGRVHASCAEVFFSDRDGDGLRELHRRKPDGNVELFTDYESMDWDYPAAHPSWSPDSARIVFDSRRDGDFEVYVMNADGSSVEQLTDHDRIDWWPAWSPDGERIAFTSDRDGHGGEIYVMNADGSGVVQLTDTDYDDSNPAWSPDGGRIAFRSNRDGDWGIYVMNADGSGVVRLAEGHSPAWSPLLE